MHDEVITFFHTSPSGDDWLDPLQIVRWSGRTYLMEESEDIGGMLHFCRDVNAGMEPRTEVHGMTYLRKGDESREATGSPDVPEKWRRYLLPRPLEGHIVRVEPESTHVIDATTSITTCACVVDIGEQDGLLAGMDLFDDPRDERFPVTMRVTSANAHDAHAEFYRDFAGQELRAGDQVSTQVIKPRPPGR